MIEQLRWIETADPVSDAKKAILVKDFRLVGLDGFTWTIPGVPGNDQFRMRDKYGLRIIEGTGDVISSDEHMRLLGRAREYARAYNEYLLSRDK